MVTGDNLSTHTCWTDKRSGTEDKHQLEVPTVTDWKWRRPTGQLVKLVKLVDETAGAASGSCWLHDHRRPANESRDAGSLKFTSEGKVLADVDWF